MAAWCCVQFIAPQIFFTSDTATASPGCCSACRDRNQQVRSHHAGVTSLTVTSCSSADNLQASDDRVQVPTHYRTIIPGWRLRTGLICCWQATPAVCQHKDTGASPDKNCHRHLRVCCFRCCRMEQLTPGTTNAVLISTNFCAKTKETPVYQLLRAHLRIFNFAPTNVLVIIIMIIIFITSFAAEGAGEKTQRGADGRAKTAHQHQETTWARSWTTIWRSTERSCWQDRGDREGSREYADGTRSAWEPNKVHVHWRRSLIFVQNALLLSRVINCWIIMMTSLQGLTSSFYV